MFSQLRIQIQRSTFSMMFFSNQPYNYPYYKCYKMCNLFTSVTKLIEIILTPHSFTLKKKYLLNMLMMKMKFSFFHY